MKPFINLPYILRNLLFLKKKRKEIVHNTLGEKEKETEFQISAK